MTDLDPEIWENRTLGAAAQNENLTRLEKQQHEDRQARVEGREPREVVIDNTYPGWTPEVQERTGTVPSNYQSVHFADEQQNDIPVESGPENETAAGIAEEDSETESSEDAGESVDTGEPGSAISDEVTTDESDSASQEDGSTKW